MDLTPRVTTDSAAPTAGKPKRDRRRLVSISLLVLVLVGGAVVVTKFLTNSLDYYCNVDEVGHKDGCEAGRSLRIQGVVEQHSKKTVDGVTTFKMTFNNVTVPVVYDGEPGGLFQECIPVVVKGVMRNGTFEGNDIEVKHTNEYNEKNKDRIAKSDTESAACSQQA
jgi:cytochrome c-type biogenesis protein CcmE